MFSQLFRKHRATRAPEVPHSPELLRSVSELELIASQRIAALLPGECRSAFRGSGMQFKEFRNYEPGDDIRHMSWTVTARTGRPTMRVYEEERELDIIAVVDVTGSSLAGIAGQTRRDMYAQLSMLTGLAAIKAGDNFGMCLFHNKTAEYFPPKKSKNHVLAIVTKLLAQPLDGRKSDLRPSLQDLGNVLSNRSLLLVFSDFLMPSFEQELRVLSRQHEIILIQCFDDLERGHVKGAVVETRDPETGNYFLLDLNSRSARKALTHAQMQSANELSGLARRSQTSHLMLSQQDDYFKRLILYFRDRAARI